MNIPRVWQRMLSGRRLDLADPSPLDIEIEDIAHGLARVARWNGQTTGNHIFSVAQHSLMVEHLVGLINPACPATTYLAALLHDAPEYVIGDMISPFKSLIGGTYREIEGRLMTAIHRRFGLPAHLNGLTERLIKKADRQSAFFESVHLAGFSDEEARVFFGEPDVELKTVDEYLVPWSINEAKERFLERYEAVQALCTQKKMMRLDQKTGTSC